MKTVGKQLQEGRLEKNWTPEMASRETKIKVERLKDLEADDFSHFNNATYARGFVRTYARALGLDEYKILRQLDNKLPDEDTANIVSAEGGVAYLPETAMPPRVAHRDYTGLYVVLGLCAAVMVFFVFVLFRAYQVGELSKWTGQEEAATTPATTTNAAVATADDQSPKKALPVDSSTPPPTPAPEPAQTNAVAAAVTPDDSTANAPKAQPVDLNAPAADTASTATATPAPEPAPTPAPTPAPAPVADNVTPAPAPESAPPKALPVDPSTLSAENTATPEAPKALPVDPSALKPADAPLPPVAPKALPVDPSTLNSGDGNAPTAPRALPVNPADAVAPTATSLDPAAPDNGSVRNGPVVLPPSDGGNAKPLVLTASQDSFVRVTMLDANPPGKVYADVLRSGQSVAFNGHKFSVTVNNPSAVDIKLDGVNYGPHDDGTDPETFTVVSHVQ
jgi:cytoskeletal protein RodZ